MTGDMHVVRAMPTILQSNVRMFAVYADKLDLSERVLHSALDGWKEELDAWKVGEPGRSWPSPLPACPTADRKRCMRQIWNWIPALSRYGRRARKIAVARLDQAREQYSETPIRDPATPPPTMLRAAINLWESRPVSVVMNPTLLRSLDSSGNTKFPAPPHVGNCADVVIGIARTTDSGFEDLANAYRYMRARDQQPKDLFDLTVLAGLILAGEARGMQLRSFDAVGREIFDLLLPTHRELRRRTQPRLRPEALRQVRPMLPAGSLFSAGIAYAPDEFSDETLKSAHARLRELARGIKMRKVPTLYPSHDLAEAEARLKAVEAELERRGLSPNDG